MDLLVLVDGQEAGFNKRTDKTAGIIAVGCLDSARWLGEAIIRFNQKDMQGPLTPVKHDLSF